MNRRKELQEALLTAVNNHAWPACTEICFRILYGLPAGMQTAFAVQALNGYLPVMEQKWPGIAWPAQLLEQPSAWLQQYGNGLPEVPDFEQPDDLAFTLGLDALLLAEAYKNDALLLTANSACALHSGVSAVMIHIWLNNDTEAYEQWQRTENITGRGMYDNEKANKAAAQQWQKLYSWLEAAEPGNYPDDVPPAALEQAYDIWNRNEGLPLTPKYKQHRG